MIFKGGVILYKSISEHYDILIQNENDPFRDPPELKEYMDKWDGDVFIDLLDTDSSKTVLEIGLGTGRLACRVLPTCAMLYGIDISQKTIERAKENLINFDNIKYITGDFLEHEFDITFDVIYSSLTFMHIKDKQKAIYKIYSLLNTNGIFVLSIDKNTADLIDASYSKIKIYPDTPKNITDCLTSSAFKITKTVQTEFAYIFVAKK